MSRCGRVAVAVAVSGVLVTAAPGVAGAAPARLSLRLLAPGAAAPGRALSIGLYKTVVPARDRVTGFSVSFGDGSRKTSGTRLPRYVTHTFAASGRYLLRASIRDAHGVTSSATISVTVAAARATGVAAGPGAPAAPVAPAAPGSPGSPGATAASTVADPSAGQPGGGSPGTTAAPTAPVAPASTHGVLSLVAGRNLGVRPGPATAPLGADGVVADSAGNIYVADSVNSDIEKVTPAGVLSIVAGVGFPGRPTAGPATSSHLNHPAGLAVDGAGDLFIADSYNSFVEKVTPGGMLSFVAGSGRRGQPVEGAAGQSSLSQPTGVAVDGAGNVYIADRYAFEVLRVTPAGRLSIYAGTGQSGQPLAGPATKTNLGGPAGLTLDAAGDVLVADAVANAIEKVTPSGRLSIIAGSSDGSAGPPASGPATASTLSGPGAVAVDGGGNLYIADTQNNSLERVDGNGALTVIAGTPTGGQPIPGPASASPLGSPVAVATDAAGDVFIADQTYFEIEKLAGTSLSIAAGAPPFGDPSPGPAAASPLSGPSGVASAADGSLILADTANNRVERVAPDGTLRIVAGTGDSGRATPGAARQSQLSFPAGVATDSHGDVYIADTDNNQVEEVTPDGLLRIVAGTGTFGKPSAGPAATTSLSLPGAVAVDDDGDIYIADTYNDDVEKVTADGTLSIIAGTSTPASSAPGPASSSGLRSPGGLALDTGGNLFIADTGNNVVERVTPEGVLSIIGGTGGTGPAVAGQATRVPLNGPVGLAVDSEGGVYVSLTSGTQIVKLSAGALSVVAGSANAPCFPTAGPAAASALYGPEGLALDPAGDLFVADSSADDVERISS